MSCVALIVALLLQISDVTSFEWKSTGSLPNGTVIPACSGQDVTFGWSFSINEADEILTNLEWLNTSEGGSQTVLGTWVMGTFFSTAGAHVQFVPNAGLQLQNVSADMAGSYTVMANFNKHGSARSETQTVELQVTDEPVTRDGQLHVQMAREAVQVTATGQFHAQLTCGSFLPVWSRRANVVWTMPNNTTMASSSQDDAGNFYLTLPNPALSGNYTCAIEDQSPASFCVESGSPLAGGATLEVDSVQAQLVVMETKIKALEKENAELVMVKEELRVKEEELQNIRNSCPCNNTPMNSTASIPTYTNTNTLTNTYTNITTPPSTAATNINTTTTINTSNVTTTGFYVNLTTTLSNEEQGFLDFLGIG